jgi:PhzF family phenazine biosynthesis protein
MGLRIFQVDSFTDQPFAGNPAGVCVMNEPLSDMQMQNVAREINASETAFLSPQKTGFNIRWFTPTVEVDLCGHATLASAHVLWEQSLVGNNKEILFHSRSGTLHANQEGAWIRLDFPTDQLEKIALLGGITEALGVQPVSVHRSGQGGYLVELLSEATVQNLQPNLDFIRKYEFGRVIVTARSESPSYDFVSRFFWPAAGIDEDPANGSSHASLGPYWSKRFGKNDLVGCQLSKRGGTVRVRNRGDRVDILGQAVTTINGDLLVLS